MLYEVFIPSEDEDGFDVTLQVEAKNWTQALKTGLDRTGEAMVRNVMADIKSDNTIHVTDATSRRVFVIRELDEDEQSEPEPDMAATVQMDTVPTPDLDAEPEPESEPEPEPEAPTHSPTPEKPAVERPSESKEAPAADEPADKKEKKKEMEVGSSTFEALQRDDTESKETRVVKEERKKSSNHAAVDIGRKEETGEKVSETLIEDVFLEIQDIHEGERTMEEAVDIVMDMVVDKLNAESGSILFADVSGQELYFATARGPKADEIMDFRVPMGQGIVGFCAREGVSLAISDAQEDPRFYEEISKALGYETRSLACSPIQHEGRVYGAIEVINREGGSTFSGQEISAMAYIGRQLAQFVNNVIMQREKIDN